MNTISIKGTARKESGSTAAKNLRKEGLVPCVVYGSSDPVHITVDERQFKKIVYTPNVYQIDLDVEGTHYMVFLKDVQFHPVSDRVIHADFFQPKEGAKVELKVPVRLEGNAIGVLNGGRLRLRYPKLLISAKVEDLPDAVTIDISKIRIGQGIRVNSLTIPGVEFLDSPENYVVSVKTARGAIEDEEDDEEEEGEAAAAEGGESTEAQAEG